MTEQLDRLKEQLLRSQADYQNLVRRGQEDRARFAKLATQDLVEALLQPLDHLEMAASQLSDPGLDMVVHQFQQVLNQFGVEEIECLGEEFDPIFMEVVENKAADSSQQAVVKKVVSKGYKLNGVVIRHAKVVVGG